MKFPLFLLCLCLPLAALPQPLALVWHRIAGGGVTGVSGGLQLQGTIGQGEASGGGGVSTVGFWNVISGGSPAVSGTVLTLVSSENPAAVGDPVSFTATLTTSNLLATTATGTVQFLTNGVAAGPAVGLSFGQATLVLATLPVGNVTVAAEYAGDASFSAANGVVYQTVNNRPPVARTYSVVRTAGLALHIFWANVATNWSDPQGYPVTLASLNYVTTNGVTVLANSSQILYPASAPQVTDRISYTITDGQGGTNTGYINVLVNPFVTGQPSGLVTVSGGVVTANFYGIPGFLYVVQRAISLGNGTVWVDIVTNTAGANGRFQVADYFADLGGRPPLAAFYRLLWQP
jgi:hypothetical protein